MRSVASSEDVHSPALGAEWSPLYPADLPTAMNCPEHNVILIWELHATVEESLNAPGS